MIRAVWELTCSNCGTEEYHPVEPLPFYKIVGPNVVISAGFDPRAYLKRVGWFCGEEPICLRDGGIDWEMLCPSCADGDLTPVDSVLQNKVG